MKRTRLLVLGTLVLALSLGALTLAGCKTTVLSGNGTALRTVTASGAGKSLSAPDTAEMTFGATVWGADAKKVLAEAGGLSDAIVAAVKKAGIDAEDIQTAGVSLYPQYTYPDNGKPTISGYEAQVSVRVMVRDIEKLGAVITAASDAGATNIYGPNWSLSEEAAQADTAIQSAIEDARRRAEAMASAVGASVGEVVTITESSVSAPILYGDRSFAEAGAIEDAVKIEPGNLEVMANVTVTFIIE